jgi:hypothetical protein
MALMPALAHAAPDVPKEKYPLLGERYRHHYLATQHDISLFDGVLPMLADLKGRAPGTRGKSGRFPEYRKKVPPCQLCSLRAVRGGSGHAAREGNFQTGQAPAPPSKAWPGE